MATPRMLADTVYVVTKDQRETTARADVQAFLTRDEAEARLAELRAAAEENLRTVPHDRSEYVMTPAEMREAATGGPAVLGHIPGFDYQIEERVDAEQYASLTKLSVPNP